MKVEENLISKQNPLSNENKEMHVKLHNVVMKIGQPKKENNLLRSRLSVTANISTLLSKNHHRK